ncbi:MAG: hypothetical protein JHC80_07150 [Polynucleobacter sp.]|jgi:hypothetical protein|nr:hypothetical protein [Polynucleobacter sp.]
MFCKFLESEDASNIARAIVGSCRLNGWSNDLIPQFLRILFKDLLNYDCDFLTLAPATIRDTIDAFPIGLMLTFPPVCPAHNLKKREELVDLLVMIEMLSNPVPKELSKSIDEWADRLGIHNQRLVVARDMAQGSIHRASNDFWRIVMGRNKTVDTPKLPEMLRNYGTKAYGITVELDQAELDRWEALQDCPSGSFGRGLWEFYKKRGFLFPGAVGAVNVGLAHHDWLHVLTDFDTDGLGEMEVFAFAAATSASPAATMAFLGHLSIFQSGVLIHVIKGEQYQGHDLQSPDGPKRIADSIRRGKAANIDLWTGLNAFDYANEQVTDLQKKWNIVGRGSHNPRPYSPFDS